MADDLLAVMDILESCKQNMMRSLETFHRRMGNNFQRLIDTVQQQSSELRQSAMTCQRKQEEEINQTFQKLSGRCPILDDEEEHVYLPIVLEEPTSPINPSSTIEDDIHNAVYEQLNSTAEPSIIHHTILDQIYSTFEPSIQVEYDFVFASGPVKIKRNYDIGFDKIYSKQYSAKALHAIKFTFTVTEFATSEFTVNGQRTSIIWVFDPGGINFVYMGVQELHRYTNERLSFWMIKRRVRRF